MPAFVQLSGALQGCTFALMNVDQENQRIVEMSSTTRNRLEYVPFIVLYVHGIPYSIFTPDERNPAANYELMKRFIIETTGKIKSKSDEQYHQNSSSGNSNANNSNTNDVISPYSIGIAGNRKRVCYLNYDNAYKKK